jgi:hypothetical protein
MKKAAFRNRVLTLAGILALLVLLAATPAGAMIQGEPTPRPTATPAPYLELLPTEGPAGVVTEVLATGVSWAAGLEVTLYWDDPDEEDLILVTALVNSEGQFSVRFNTPTAALLATVGTHMVYAVQDGMQAEADFELLPVTPTFTPTPTRTPSPTSTSPPTPTGTATVTPTPTPTLRPVTPMVPITPIPPTRTKPPAPTNTPRPKPTNTPLGTATPKPTASQTPTPSATPGPGTPAATPEATTTPAAELAQTGGSWGLTVLLGSVLAAAVVGLRLLRVRVLPPG